jgi:hypothetical protein
MTNKRTIGINENRATDLAYCLKTLKVKASEILEGDFVYDEHSIWSVVRISHNERNDLILHEKDGNDIGIPEHLHGMTMTIIDRSILRTD